MCCFGETIEFIRIIMLFLFFIVYFFRLSSVLPSTQKEQTFRAYYLLFASEERFRFVEYTKKKAEHHNEKDGFS
jgi:hypothetical protein